ncbi:MULTISPECIES: serine/threonine-protein kinase [Cellulomonas]|uniref:serine/threonine-protein kinase n=1 Tax=Cellulomonas TaxID=1707 RepID=UPI001FE59DD9|nr:MULTISPECIES: serine/threonine-protein kinase [Cellulomonas]
MARRVAGTPPVLPGYTYVRPLGVGGFADVFCYEQDMPRRVVAVKVLAEGLHDPVAQRAFEAEADVLARLSVHPSVVTVHQASVSADGRPYIVMEYCLDTYGARARRAPLPVPEVLDVGVRLASALETAHRSGVLHRDIKPSNVLRTSLGTPALADFGIAAAVSGSTGVPAIAMSVPWSAPEVLEERVAGSVAAEVWSLGATLWTLLTGRAPFEVGDRARDGREEMASRIVRAKLRPMGREDVPERVEQVLARAMSKDPAHRHPSMLALAEELRWAQYDLGQPPTALEVPSAEWAAGASPVEVEDRGARGPVVSRVRERSRAEARAERAAAEAAVDRDGLVVHGPARRAAWQAGVVGAVVGALAVAAVVVVLALTGVLG